MKLAQLLLVSLPLGIALASPFALPEPDATVKDATAAPDASPSVPSTCGEAFDDAHTYSVEAQVDAEDYTKHLIRTNQTVRSLQFKDYPSKYYNSPEGIIFDNCPENVAPFKEFPVNRDGTLFSAGTAAGPDRIVIKELDPDTLVFCGLMTHQGAKTYRGFVQCIKDTDGAAASNAKIES